VSPVGSIDVFVGSTLVIVVFVGSTVVIVVIVVPTVVIVVIVVPTVVIVVIVGSTVVIVVAETPVVLIDVGPPVESASFSSALPSSSASVSPVETTVVYTFVEPSVHAEPSNTAGQNKRTVEWAKYERAAIGGRATLTRRFRADDVSEALDGRTE
jgi:hypothetical protein